MIPNSVTTFELLFDRIDLPDNLLFQERTRLNQELNLIRYNIELRWCLTLPLQCCYRVWRAFTYKRSKHSWHENDWHPVNFTPVPNEAKEFWICLEETLKEMELL